MGDQGWRRVTALVESLVSNEAPPANVSVIIDATDAAPTNGEAGVYLEAGPNVGREALQAVLGDADTKVIGRTAEGRFLDYGRRRRTAPPALKRALIHAAQGQCQADGCTSRHRLQIHHLTPGPKADEPTSPTSLSSAGTTTRSSSTNEASRSTSTTKAESDSAARNGDHRTDRMRNMRYRRSSSRRPRSSLNSWSNLLGIGSNRSSTTRPPSSFQVPRT